MEGLIKKLRNLGLVACCSLMLCGQTKPKPIKPEAPHRSIPADVAKNFAGCIDGILNSPNDILPRRAAAYRSSSTGMFPSNRLISKPGGSIYDEVAALISKKSYDIGKDQNGRQGVIGAAIAGEPTTAATLKSSSGNGKFDRITTTYFDGQCGATASYKLDRAKRSFVLEKDPKLAPQSPAHCHQPDSIKRITKESADIPENITRKLCPRT